MTTTERTVILNSRFRANRQDTSTDFNILLNRAVNVDDVDRIIVKRVSMPNLFYNVPARKSKLYIEYEGVPGWVTVPPGQYNADRFVIALEIALKTLTDDVVVSINYDTGKLTLGCPGSTIGWTILSHTDVKEQFGVDESINTILGTSHDVTLPAALSWTSPGLVDLSGEHTVRIESSTLAFSNSFDSRGQILNTVEIVPVHEPYGATIHYAPTDHIMSFVDSGSTGRQINSVDIRLVSNSGQPLVLPDNAYTEIVLLVIFRHNQF